MIIATSGHVDHGKTALLEALTGTHTAHLPEEKKRGMTIDLGYAYLSLNNNQQQSLGFIDVPGHEKFLANMLAGLGGLDYAMLVIAANEGIQAQTREHLAILKLLSFHQVILVISKADLASSSQIEQLLAEIHRTYPFLIQAPYFVTSAKTGQGILELRQYLSTLPNLALAQSPFRYAIDRIFHIKGAGTVVTGTAFAGNIQINDEVFLSSGQKVRIKNIHSQNQPSPQGSAGDRLALNIHRDDRTLIGRGDWLFSQPPQSTERITVQLESAVALKENQVVHLYHAATRCMARLNLLQHKKLAVDQQALAEVILDKPLFLMYGDRLILRSGDAQQVIGGAKVIEINSPTRYKRTPERLAYLQQLQQAKTLLQRTALYLQNKAMRTRELAWIEQLSEEQLIQLLTDNHYAVCQDWCFDGDYQSQQKTQLLTALVQYHQQHNDQLGVSKARLYRIACLKQPEPLVYHFIEQLLQEGKLLQTRGWLHLPEHKIEFDEQEQQLWSVVLQTFESQKGQPLWVRDLATQFDIDEKIMRQFLYKAGKLGYLTPIVKDRFFLTSTLYAYAKLIKTYIQQHQTISVNQLRDELAFGRKLTVQLMEYFDRTGFLRRKGNVHILRDAQLFGD